MAKTPWFDNPWPTEKASNIVKTKSWKRVDTTPAGGKVYHKEGVNDILVVYNRVIVLHKNIRNVGNQKFVPAFAEYKLVRER